MASRCIALSQLAQRAWPSSSPGYVACVHQDHRDGKTGIRCHTCTPQPSRRRRTACTCPESAMQNLRYKKFWEQPSLPGKAAEELQLPSQPTHALQTRPGIPLRLGERLEVAAAVVKHMLAGRRVAELMGAHRGPAALWGALDCIAVTQATQQTVLKQIRVSWQNPHELHLSQVSLPAMMGPPPAHWPLAPQQGSSWSAERGGNSGAKWACRADCREKPSLQSKI